MDTPIAPIAPAINMPDSPAPSAGPTWRDKIPLLSSIWQRLDLIEEQQRASPEELRHQFNQLRVELRGLEHQIAALRLRKQPLVFFHLAKTGGSSIWWALAGAAPGAAAPPVPVIDLYDLMRRDHHSVTGMYAVLDRAKTFVRENRILIHHHTSHPIALFCDEQPVYTTIIRDPAERFVSEINHVRAQLQGDFDALHQSGLIDPKVEMEGRGWPRDLVEKAASPQASLEELLVCALKEPYFARYYYWNFYHLLVADPESLPARVLPAKVPSDESLAILIKAKFAHLGRFPQVFETYQETARIFQFPETLASADFPHMLQRKSLELAPQLRDGIRLALAEDYAFLRHLGFDFQAPNRAAGI